MEIRGDHRLAVKPERIDRGQAEMAAPVIHDVDAGLVMAVDEDRPGDVEIEAVARNAPGQNCGGAAIDAVGSRIAVRALCGISSGKERVSAAILAF